MTDLDLAPYERVIRSGSGLFPGEVSTLVAEVRRLRAEQDEVNRAALAWQEGSQQAWSEVDRLRAERDRLIADVGEHRERGNENFATAMRMRGERDQASADGWAEGEQWVMDHLWEYAALRTRLGRFLWRLRSRWRCRNLPLPTEIIEEDRR